MLYEALPCYWDGWLSHDTLIFYDGEVLPRSVRIGRAVVQGADSDYKNSATLERGERSRRRGICSDARGHPRHRSRHRAPHRFERQQRLLASRQRHPIEPESRPNQNRVPHPCRVLCDRVGPLTLASVAFVAATRRLAFSRRHFQTVLAFIPSQCLPTV